MTKQHKKFSRKVSRLVAEFTANLIDSKEFNRRMTILVKTAEQLKYI